MGLRKLGRVSPKNESKLLVNKTKQTCQIDLRKIGRIANQPKHNQSYLNIAKISKYIKVPKT